jgi:hypothetical protein
MQSYVSIPIIVEPIEETDSRRRIPARTRRSTAGASVRIFLWSVFFGMTMGVVARVVEPEQSMKVSLETRAWIKTHVVRARAAVGALHTTMK